MPERFYVPEPPEDRRVLLVGDEAHHLSRVRRVAVGEVVELFDGQGRSYRARVESLGRERVELIAETEPVEQPLPPRDLTLASAVPKGERFDWLIEKATELGVARVVPLITERSVVEPGAAKLARLRRLIIESSKQCGRNRLMALEEPVRWTEFAVSAQAEFRLLAHPAGLDRNWPDLAAAALIALAIGPEGGWTHGEVELGTARGWQLARLGSTILRIETAAIAGAAVLLCGPGIAR